MVRVDVDDGDPVDAGGPQRFDGDGGVVEVARAAERIPGRMVTGRSADRVGDVCAAGDQVDRGQRRIDRRPSRRPCARADQRHGVVAVKTGPRVHRRRSETGMPSSMPVVGNTYGTTFG